MLVYLFCDLAGYFSEVYFPRVKPWYFTLEGAALGKQSHLGFIWSVLTVFFPDFSIKPSDSFGITLVVRLH